MALYHLTLGGQGLMVDLATYKSEFLSHFYEVRLRPRAAYAMGWIDKWARLGSQVPAVSG